MLISYFMCCVLLLFLYWVYFYTLYYGSSCVLNKIIYIYIYIIHDWTVSRPKVWPDQSHPRTRSSCLVRFRQRWGAAAAGADLSDVGGGVLLVVHLGADGPAAAASPHHRVHGGGDLLLAGVRAGARGLLLQQHLHALLLVARAEAQRGALGQWALPFPHSLRTFTAAFNRETSGLFRHMYVLKVTVDGLYF